MEPGETAAAWQLLDPPAPCIRAPAPRKPGPRDKPGRQACTSLGCCHALGPTGTRGRGPGRPGWPVCSSGAAVPVRTLMSGCCPVSPPPQQDACPDQPPVGGRALGSHGERASAAGLCYLSLPKIPEAGFRAFPSESLKGPERVHRHSQACPGPKPWPAPLCVFPSAVGSQLGPTRPPPCSAELRSGPATTGGPMSREPRGGASPLHF